MICPTCKEEMQLKTNNSQMKEYFGLFLFMITTGIILLVIGIALFITAFWETLNQDRIFTLTLLLASGLFILAEKFFQVGGILTLATIAIRTLQPYKNITETLFECPHCGKVIYWSSK